MARVLLRAAGILLACAGGARAQLLDQYIPPSVAGAGIEPGVTVQSRSHPELEAAGIRVGNVVVRPTLTESFGYESNVLGAGHPVGSALLETNAAVAAASDWSRNSVHAELAVDDARYLDQPRQSYTNLTASLGGSYQIGRDVLTGLYQHLHLNQTTRDLDVPQLEQPLGYDIDLLTVGYRINFNRLSLTPAMNVSNYEYANGVAGGLPYVQSFRDRVVVTPSMTAAYEFAPLRSAVLVLRDGTGIYSHQQLGVPNRNYNDWAVLGGLDYNVNGVWRFRLLGGYEMRLFSNAAYQTLQAPIVEASVIWSPTGLTTVTGTVSRHIQDTADETTAAFTQTSVLLSVDHEYLRNVLLRGTGRVDLGEYGQGGGEQTLYTAGASVTYMANRYARLSLGYEFQSRRSSTAGTLGAAGQTFGSNYVDHRLLLQLKLSL